MASPPLCAHTKALENHGASAPPPWVWEGIAVPPQLLPQPAHSHLHQHLIPNQREEAGGRRLYMCEPLASQGCEPMKFHTGGEWAPGGSTSIQGLAPRKPFLPPPT